MPKGGFQVAAGRGGCKNEILFVVDFLVLFSRVPAEVVLSWPPG